MDRHCIECKHESESVYSFPCTECVYNGGDDDMSEPKIITNADRIRSMTDEELAVFLCKISECKPDYCPAYHSCIIESDNMETWLQKDSEV